jgi:hypothetical protein
MPSAAAREAWLRRRTTRWRRWGCGSWSVVLGGGAVCWSRGCGCGWRLFLRAVALRKKKGNKKRREESLGEQFGGKLNFGLVIFPVGFGVSSSSGERPSRARSTEPGQVGRSGGLLVVPTRKSKPRNNPIPSTVRRRHRAAPSDGIDRISGLYDALLSASRPRTLPAPLCSPRAGEGSGARPHRRRPHLRPRTHPRRAQLRLLAARGVQAGAPPRRHQRQEPPPGDPCQHPGDGCASGWSATASGVSLPNLGAFQAGNLDTLHMKVLSSIAFFHVAVVAAA